MKKTNDIDIDDADGWAEIPQTFPKEYICECGKSYVNPGSAMQHATKAFHVIVGHP